MTRQPQTDNPERVANPDTASLARRIDMLERRNRQLEIRASLLTVAVMVLFGLFIGLLTSTDRAADVEAGPAAWGNFAVGLAICLITVGFGLVSLIATFTAWRHGTQPHPFTTYGVFGAVLLLALPLIVAGLESGLGSASGNGAGSGLLGWMDHDLRTLDLVATIVLALIWAFNVVAAAVMRRVADAEEKALE